jgi:hypothetical protein
MANRSRINFIPQQIVNTILLCWESWFSTPAVINLVKLAGFGLVYLLVGIYIVSALISKKNLTLYYWAAGSYVVADN